jgi:hypothetical protein
MQREGGIALLVQVAVAQHVGLAEHGHPPSDLPGPDDHGDLRVSRLRVADGRGPALVGDPVQVTAGPDRAGRGGRGVAAAGFAVPRRHRPGDGHETGQPVERHGIRLDQDEVGAGGDPGELFRSQQLRMHHDQRGVRRSHVGDLL